MKILYIGSKVFRTQSGADVVNYRNQKILEQYANVDYVEIHSSDTLWDKLCFSVNSRVISKIKFFLDHNKYDYIFIQQSTLGRAVKYIKCNYPRNNIILFFHNIEKSYARAYLSTNGIKAVPFYLLVRIWEKIACDYSDSYITLNSRDSKLLEGEYNKKANLELPTSLTDLYNNEKSELIKHNEGVDKMGFYDFLFVGVSFFANIQGIQWFIDNVMPKVDGTLCIVGKGMDKVNFNNLTDKIQIYGYVEDLAEYYYHSRIVVSPIFSGAGMKTKTAEALMYGKTILGTTESFEGYEIDERCMKCCNSATEFIDTINKLRNTCEYHNPYSRKLYLDNYSLQSTSTKMGNFLLNYGDK